MHSGRSAPAMVPFQTSAKEAMPALSPDSSGARGTATSSTLPATVTFARAPGSCRSPLHAQQGALHARSNLARGTRASEDRGAALQDSSGRRRPPHPALCPALSPVRALGQPAKNHG